MALLLHVLSGGVVAGCVYALTAVGLTLIFGVLRVANFAQGEFYMIGGLLLYLLVSRSVPYPLALLIAVAGGALIGIVVEFIAIRPLRDKPHEAVFLSTFAVSVATINGVSTLIGGQPLSVPGVVGGVVKIGDFVAVS